MRKSKAFKLETLLTERIRMGDYAFVRFPSERKLAESFDVTQMTARKATLNLERQGLLKRRPNGTLYANAEGDGKKGSIAILMPTYPSNHSFMCQRAATGIAEANGWLCRTSLYMHWDDAIIEESVKSFDGVFIIAVSEPMPERVAKLLNEAPVACLGGDLCEHGIPSLMMEPETVVAELLAHLKSRGHSKIDFLNAQPHTAAILLHEREWREQMGAGEGHGEMFDVAVESYGNSYERAIQFVSSRLDDGEFKSRCLLCSSMAEAIGACRALTDHGLSAGEDVAIASIGGGDMARLYIPSITSVAASDCAAGVGRCLSWMENGAPPWSGPLRLWTDGKGIFIGESSVGTRKGKASRQ